MLGIGRWALGPDLTPSTQHQTSNTRYPNSVDANSLNKMLEARVKDLAARGPSVKGPDARKSLLRALGLDPLPDRTDLKPVITGTIRRDGYRIEKLRYESVPGLIVTAHLYIPDGNGPFPVILNPHGHWRYKKVEPVVQARGISLALEGFAALIVDSPGGSWDANEVNERKGIGDHNNWFLNLGRCIQGVYAWDLMRGLDYLETRPEMDCLRVGITGTSGGGTATMYTFAIDDRISCAVPACYATSMEVNPHNGCLCNHVPGAMDFGDRAHILAMRAPAPIMLIGATNDEEFPPEGHKKTFEKLKAIYKSKKKESNVRLELVEGGHDYSRRMREAMVAFFREHLLGEPARTHVPEKRPLTDGAGNPFEAGTASITDPRLMVTTWFERETKSFSDLLDESVALPKPDPFVPAERMIGWGRHGRIAKLQTHDIVSIHDVTVVAPSSDSIALPIDDVDQRLCIYLGLSVPEYFAQWLHVSLPSGPEGWESARVGSTSGDALTSMIASVKTLVSSSNPEVAPSKLIAKGEVASMTAMFLKLYRPNLEIETSQKFEGWSDALKLNIRQLVQPSARYLNWPF